MGTVGSQRGVPSGARLSHARVIWGAPSRRLVQTLQLLGRVLRGAKPARSEQRVELRDGIVPCQVDAIGAIDHQVGIVARNVLDGHVRVPVYAPRSLEEGLDLRERVQASARAGLHDAAGVRARYSKQRQDDGEGVHVFSQETEKKNAWRRTTRLTF